MLFKSDTSVQCHFSGNNLPEPKNSLDCVELYFAETKDLISGYSKLSKIIYKEDKLKADNLLSEEDRYTYLFCHTFLRLILSKKLGIPPDDIRILYDENKKPYIEGNPLYFNLSHCRDAFAFAISHDSATGIDLEKTDRNIDFESISKRFFHKDETEFISGSQVGSIDRFFLLWTRKEALLKAIGTGITVSLMHIEVFRQDNILERRWFDRISSDSISGDYFIYSKKLLEYYISVAISQKSSIVIYQDLLSLLESY